MKTIEVDVAIIGGSLGSVAAARALLKRGLRVAMTEEFAWIGGQATSQAMCVPDEYHDPIFEGGGCCLGYFKFREELRNYYKDNFGLSREGASQIHFNPTGGPKPVAAEPHVAKQVIMDGFHGDIEAGRLQIFTGFIPESAVRADNRIQSVTCVEKANPSNSLLIKADFFLSGDEIGDLYPVLDLGFRLGAEGKNEFGEEHAPDEAAPNSVQAFTFTFALEYVPGEDFTIPKPAEYEKWRKIHGSAFRLGAPGSRPDEPAYMFRIRTGRGGIRIKPAFYYRSTVANHCFDDPRMAYSRTIINVDANDYCYGNFVGKPEAEKERVLDEARQLALAYLYWMQTEAPRDDGDGVGYPELRPMPESTGAEFGLAMAPYVREGRRLKACQTVVEQDISTQFQPSSRARNFTDSIGLGCFLIDIHKRVGAEGLSQMSRPYQIPLGSLVCEELDNFAVAGKGIGVTQITNGAYRLHTIEWNIGEAAGELAAYCLEKHLEKPRLHGRQLFDFQRRLLKEGFMLYWYEDLPIGHPGFEAVQLLSLKGIWPGNPHHLRFNTNYSIVREVKLFNHILDKLERGGVPMEDFRELLERQVCTRLYDFAHRLMCYLDDVGWPELAFEDEIPNAGDEVSEVFNDFIPEPMDESDLPGRPSLVS